MVTVSFFSFVIIYNAFNCSVRFEMDAELAGLVSWQVQRCGVVAGDL